MKDLSVDRDLFGGLAERVRSSSLVTLMTDQIERLILQNQLREGDQLPPESELCRQFGVSRTVVREALARLSAKNLIEVRGGAGGITISRPSVANISDSLRFLLQSEMDGARADKILEVRRLLEIEIAGLAAERRSQTDLATLETILAQTQAERAVRERFAELDVAFHKTLAQATQNELFVLLLDSLGAVLLPMRLLGYSTPGNPDRAIRFHRSILDEVIGADRSRAREAMRLHLTEAEETMRVAMAAAGRPSTASHPLAQPMDKEPIGKEKENES